MGLHGGLLPINATVSARISNAIYLQQNWAPRGSETAKILYNISEGWVTHDEVGVIRIFSLATLLTGWLELDECKSTV